MNGDSSQPTYVIVEEEEKIRSKWQQIAFEKNLDLVVYDNPEEFLLDLSVGHFSDSHRFFLDQDFGPRRGVGVSLAQAIRERHSAYISLITAYPKALFRNELLNGLIDDVSGKYPSPFDSPIDTAFEHRFDDLVWTPLLKAGLADLTQGGHV